MTNLLDSKPLKLSGLIPATITPFTKDGAVEMDALRRHIRETADTDGVTGIVVNAFLGEILQLTAEDKVAIIQAAKAELRPGQLLIAGLEGRNAAQYVADGNAAKAAGADALLVLPPFDVRPYRRLARDTRVVHEFFSALDKGIGLPMIVFQYGERSGCAYPVEVLQAIAEIPNVVGVKCSCDTVTHYVAHWEGLKDSLSVLAAVDQPSLLGMLMHGAHGSLIGISVVGTKRWSDLIATALSGDLATAQAIHREFCVPLMASLFENQEPTSSTSEVSRIKEALVQLGQIPNSNVREPAVGVTDAHREVVRRSLAAVGLTSARG